MSEFACQHVCPRCSSHFTARPEFADTYCPECFGEAYGVIQKPATRWNRDLRAGIICIAGAIILFAWLLAR